MGRLLDEDDVIDWVFKRTEMHDAAGLFVDEGVVRKNIEAQIAKIPSVQPEVIRCKECKHADFGGLSDGRLYCMWNECHMYEDDYCSNAEREKET